MDFINQFTAHAILAALVAGLWFSVPGAWVGRWLGWYPQLRLSTLLVAPFLGLCTFGAFSLVLTTMIGYSTFTLGCSWLLFQLLVLLASRRQYCETEVFYPLSMPLSVLLLVGIGLWALIPTLHIMPFVDQNALFVDKHIYDHAKIALVDAIAREGLLPINPYYAPGGETILLNYYYSWHFLVSQLKLLLPISGWQAEVAMSWFTGFAVVGLLAALAIQITQKARAGFLLLLCAALGQPTALLYAHFNLEWKQWFAYPSEHGLELLLDQMMWVPQHVFSATAVVLVIFLVSRLLLTQRLQMHYIVIGGLTVATAFGASTWIGGIGLLLASPIFLLLVLSLRLPKSHYLNLFKALLLMALIGIAAALPLLISQTAGPGADLPFSLSIYRSTALMELTLTPEAIISHIILFWLEFLPLNLGIVFLLGLVTVWIRPVVNEPERSFQKLSIAGIIGFLLVVQFFQSTFWNNTFGWRAVLVPVLLLSLWSAVALSELSSGYLGRARLQHWQSALISLVLIAGLTIGLLSGWYIGRLPDFTRRAQDLAVHQGFLRQHRAWAKVRAYTQPSDRVQANPDGYASLTPWPVALPAVLFSNRSSAYANVNNATVFAYRYDQTQNRQQYRRIQKVFSQNPAKSDLRYLRETLKVKAVLVDQFDPAWNSQAIENSGYYELVYTAADFKIYRAP